jgi:uncharacterized membrane protein YgdD (TMEM256/DUF423 family)
LSGDALSVWQTAVQYHFWHALALLATAQLAGAWAKAAGWFFITGVFVFSGTLYALALDAPRTFGMITPVGGVALILGWIAFAIAAIRA